MTHEKEVWIWNPTRPSLTLFLEVYPQSQLGWQQRTPCMVKVSARMSAAMRTEEACCKGRCTPTIPALRVEADGSPR